VNELPYKTYRSFLKNKFGAPVLRIPLDGGFSCPNRDGRISLSGCSFCDNASFSPAVRNNLPAIIQLQQAIERDRGRHSHFIAYLQPFSNTYGTIEQLRTVYEPLIQRPGVSGIAIGTRPDCIDSEIAAYLADIAARTCLCVELGLQSGSDAVLSDVNRGHTYAQFEAAVNLLAQNHIEIAAHVIIGLPGETDEMLYRTAERLAHLPIAGIKIHQLMIIDNTTIADRFNKREIEPISLLSYAEKVSQFIMRLNPNQCLHRIMADSQKEHGLIAPQWSSEKTKSIAFIHDYMKKNGIVQGTLYAP
jgi:radical SAM protein (TIGR01212 family)